MNSIQLEASSISHTVDDFVHFYWRNISKLWTNSWLDWWLYSHNHGLHIATFILHETLLRQKSFVGKNVNFICLFCDETDKLFLLQKYSLVHLYRFHNNHNHRNRWCHSLHFLNIKTLDLLRFCLLCRLFETFEQYKHFKHCIILFIIGRFFSNCKINHNLYN